MFIKCWTNKLIVVHPHDGILCNKLVTSNNMEEYKILMDEWKKPVIKEGIGFDCIYVKF